MGRNRGGLKPANTSAKSQNGSRAVNIRPFSLIITSSRKYCKYFFFCLIKTPPRTYWKSSLFSLKHLQDDILNIWALLRENYYWEICLQWIQNQNKKPKSRNICLSSWQRRKRESKGLKTALCDSGDCKCWTVLVHQSLLTRRVNTLCLHTQPV